MKSYLSLINLWDEDDNFTINKDLPEAALK